MKLAVVGGRDFKDYKLMNEILFDITSYTHTIISGGARGADSLAKRWAYDNKRYFKEYLPNWNAYGKSAGFIRNKKIVDDCDKLIAFWDGKSKGTQHSINLAKQQGKLLDIVYY